MSLDTMALQTVSLSFGDFHTRVRRQLSSILHDKAGEVPLQEYNRGIAWQVVAALQSRRLQRWRSGRDADFRGAIPTRIWEMASARAYGSPAFGRQSGLDQGTLHQCSI